MHVCFPRALFYNGLPKFYKTCILIEARAITRLARTRAQNNEKYPEPEVCGAIREKG